MTDFALHRRAQDCIAQSYLTNSKRPESHVKGVYPTHVARGHGPYLFDHKGKRYLDFVCGLGTNLLGYGNARVAQAISERLMDGYSHSFATHHELECAEKVKELFPFIDAVKFLKSGSEACSAAIRIARAATGRKWILSHAYHGWHDPFVSLTPPHYGVPTDENRSNHWIKPWEPGNEYLLDETAAIIVEPVITDWSDERRSYLQKLRETCTKHGVLLIFDEVITGFRWPQYSVSTHWSITPDLIVLAKALGGGMPLAAVGGKYAVMNAPNEYFVSSTYAGEVLSLVAAKQVMTLLQTKYDPSYLWERGQVFLDDFNALDPHVQIAGYPSRGAFTGDPFMRALFFQEACKAGVLFGPSFFLSFAHFDEMAGLMDLFRDIFARIRGGKVSLEGELPRSAFAAKVREAKS